MYILVNNRAEGNAPFSVQALLQGLIQYERSTVCEAVPWSVRSMERGLRS